MNFETGYICVCIALHGSLTLQLSPSPPFNPFLALAGSLYTEQVSLDEALGEDASITRPVVSMAELMFVHESAPSVSRITGIGSRVWMGRRRSTRLL